MRYLNNVGDNERGIIGEEKKGIKKNMMKIIDKVENGRREKMKIWGKEYKKKDGKGVREYINVKDMDEGKIKEMKKMDKKKWLEVNIGKGKGYSVIDVIKEFENV